MLYWTIILICIAEFLYSTWLYALNQKASSLPIPSVLAGIYDKDTYLRQQNYRKKNARIGFVSTCVDTAILLSLFALGGFTLFDHIARSLTTSAIPAALIFFGLVYLCSWIPGIPFGAYGTFVIEQQFGFNRTTVKTYVLDLIKGLLLTVIIGGVILTALVWIYTSIPHYFWIAAWGCITAFSLFMQFFYSDLIVPLFNKQTPLQEGELRTAIESFARSVNFKLKNIYVINGSKRSAHANAYFTGYGARKRIVLYDTLMEQLTTEEIVGVLAHEIGHYKHRHIYKSMVSSMLTNLVLLYVFGLVMNSSAIAAACHCQPSFHINLMVFSLIYSPFNEVLSIIDNQISRRHEWQADEFAKTHGLGPAVSSALKKMSAKSLSNLTPHPWVVRLQYSHPTLKDRVLHLE